jgi:hypothetical protein
MIKKTGVMILLAVALAGAGCEGSDTAATTPSDVANPEAPSDEAVVHASLSLGGDHVLEFTEFKPGLLGVVEKGRSMVDVPKMTPELGKLAFVDVYRHFAGSAAPISKGMAAAQARALAKAAEPMSVSPRELGTGKLSPMSADPRQLDKTSTGEGPHFYNDAEQAWFRTNFCNGARSCIQGWWYANDYSQGKVGRSSAFALNGSESKVTAKLTEYYQSCAWTIFYGTECWWFPFGSANVPPGWWAGVTQVSGVNYIYWELSGSERNTQVSLEATY